MSLATGNKGQVFLEYAISLAGVVSLIFVLLKVWNWVNTTMILRQESFQNTRIEAGTRGDAPGLPVPYQAGRDTPLVLVGLPGFTDGNVPTGPGTVPPSSEWCDAGRPFFEEAQRLRDEAAALGEQRDDIWRGGDQKPCAPLRLEDSWDPTTCSNPRADRMALIHDVLIPNKEAEIQNKTTEINNARDEIDHINLVELPAIDQQIQDLQDALANEVDPQAIQAITDAIAALEVQRQQLIDRRDYLNNTVLPGLWVDLGMLEGELRDLETELTTLADAVTQDNKDVKELGLQAIELQTQAQAQVELGLAACGLRPEVE